MADTWRVVIVDDEPPARRTLQALLAQYSRFRVVEECGHAAAAVDALRRHRPDVVFLDVQMPDGTGLSALAQVGPDADPVVVFTTAYAEYAVAAFEAQALDYLLKPFSDERFHAVMRRVTHSLEQARLTAVEREQMLTIRDAGKTFVIPIQEIDRIEAEDYCARIHAGGRRLLVRRSLQSLVEELHARGFVRVHRSSVVNLASVRQVTPLGSGDQEIVLADGATVRLSRNFRDAFHAQLSARAGR